MGQYKNIAVSYGGQKREGHPVNEMIYGGWLKLCCRTIGEPDLQGLSIVDIACGPGHSSRILARAQADEVIGIDPEYSALKVARLRESRERLGIYYLQGKLPYEMPAACNVTKFDLVTGAYLLNNAQTKKELFDMLKEIFRILKPGGYFFGINNDPSHPATQLNLVAMSHKSTWLDTPWMEGSRVKVEIVGVEDPIVIFWWSPETYKEAFRAAGFSPLEFSPCKYPEEDRPENWEFIEQDVSVTMMSARKPA